MEPSREIRLKDFLSPKSDGMIRATIARRIEEIISAYPKITVAQHMKFIFRSKGEVQGDPYKWGDERTLDKIEKYKLSLMEQYNKEDGEFDDEPIDQEFLNERYGESD